MLKSVAVALCLLAVASSSYAQQVIGGCSILPATSVWNTPVDTLPVLANSSSMVNTIGASRGFHADFGAGMWDGGPIGIPFITVNGSQAKYAASFLYADESDPGPYAVPLNVPIEGGPNATGDRHAIALDTTNCILYEFFRAFPNSSTWTADSGAIYDLTSNALRPQTWTSADAAGLPILPGLITYDELLSGEIKHAIRFTAPQTRREFVWPARHYASSLTGTQYPRMGERFRLKASFDISGYPADIQVILRAMKKYGIILADNGSSWFISGAPDSRWNDDNLHRLGQLLGSNFEAVDATVLRVSADSGAAIQSGVNVAVSPTTASLRLDQTQTFAATVTGATGGVSWSVNNVSGGDAIVGTIDTSGRYTPPSAVPSPSTVTVRATSVSTPTANGTASVALLPIPAPPTPTPPPATPPPAT
ncbi:MAG: Ig-like domain-containing protein, partial [Vicinamibacterales bacterium]